MLNVWVHLRGTTGQWYIGPGDPINRYMHKQMSFLLSSFIYLTNSCTITFEQLFTAVGRFNMVWLYVSDISCLSFQSLSV